LGLQRIKNTGILVFSVSRDVGCVQRIRKYHILEFVYQIQCVKNVCYVIL